MKNQTETLTTKSRNVTVVILKRTIWSFVAFVIIAVFTYVTAIGYLLPGFNEIFKLTPETTTIDHVGLMLIPIVSYLLIAFNLCLLLNIRKKLKDCEEKDSIFGLIISFIFGLISCIGFGVILGLMLFISLGFILGSIVGLILGLILGFIVCFYIALRFEFD